MQYPGFSLDKRNECNYCKRWERKWEHLDFAEQAGLLERLLNKHRGKSKPYDCLVGLSGGKDSCYAAYVLKKHGMKPLGCTFDNGFLTETALDNINNTVKALSIGHVFVHYDADFLSELYRQCLLAAGEFCSVYNTGIKSTLYRTAKSYGIDLVVSGQSTRTEANSPKEYYTASSGYFHNVMKTAFSKKEIGSFVYVSQLKRVCWHLRHSPFYLQLPSYMRWKEEEFIKEIADHLGWEGSFGEQHTDCRMSDAKEYLKFKKFEVTELTAKLSSLIRDKQISRKKALELLEKQVLHLRENESTIREQIKNEFHLSAEEFDKAIHASHLPYLSKTDTLLSEAKKLHESLRFRKKE